MINDRFPADTYAREGEDRILLSLFRSVETGIYLDVGAHHPIRNSNTYLLYTRGWSGLAVDGNPGLRTAWETDRPRDVFITAVVADCAREEDFTFLAEDHMNTLCPSTAREFNERHGVPVLHAHRVQTRTVSALWREYLSNQAVNLLSMVVNGYELPVLEGARLDEMKPDAILAEVKNYSLHDVVNCDIVEYLSGRGYGLIARSLQRSIFVRRDSPRFDWLPRSLLRCP